MISRVIRQPLRAVSRRNMSLKSALGDVKQDIAASQKNNLDMNMRWVFLRGGQKDEVTFAFTGLMALGIVFSVVRGGIRMASK